MTPTRTTCPYCGVGCGILATAGGGVDGDPDHPANFGRLCSKGLALGETLGPEGRLLRPKLRGEEIAWDAALDLMAGKFSAAIRDHGPDSVAFYVSGQLLTEDYYVANKLMKGFIGSANIDTNSRLCMASSVAGHRRAFGTDTVPGCYEDLETADLIVLAGSNLAWCHPVLFQRIAAAKAARPQMKVVTIDPRITATTDLADLHLPVAPDGDTALFNGLLSRLAAEGKRDGQFVADHVDGFADALAAADATDPGESGLDPALLERFFRLWIDTERVVTVYSQGINQSAGGTDKVNAILNCHLATGRIGRPGMGPFSVTGQPNAMGGREVGGLANMLACHLDLEDAEHRKAVQAAWQSPAMAAAPGLRAVDLFRACADGRIKALWVMSTNPAVSLPDADAVAEAIAGVPFTVVSDIVARTDTGDLADLLLPAAGWGEKSGTVTNSERRISRQRAFLAAPGEARPDWRIICDFAARMGWAEAFDYPSPAAIFREYAALSGIGAGFGRSFDISGLASLSDAAYDTMQPVQWPVPGMGPAGGRFFADGRFHHPGGRARMIAVSGPEPRSARASFRLNTGRIRDQWHTMTRSGRSPRLSAHLGEPYAEIHPEDARRIGVAAAELIHIRSESGAGVFRVMLSDRVRPGNLFAPMHWTRQNASAGCVNRLIAPETDPLSGQPASKAGQAEARRFEAAWYGFVAARDPIAPVRPYAAVARNATGWQAEIAGTELPRDWEAEARDITGIRGGSASLLRDDGTGTARVALIDGGTIRALFFAAREPVRTARRHVAGLVGAELPALAALAGRPEGEAPDPGATVCACFSVGVNDLRAAILGGAGTVEELGARTCAGTGCGSCRPELAALIAQAGLRVAAE